VKNIQKNEKLSRNETISLLVELGIKLNKHKELLVKTAERKNISQDTVLEEMFRQT
jgi:sialic acid synthase SpsE